MVERIERGGEAAPDRGGARGRHLLAADDRGKAGIAGLAPPQRRHARDREHGLKPRILPDQRVNGLFEVGLGVEVEGHCENLFTSSWPGLSRPSTSYAAAEYDSPAMVRAR
jgi:hypothetical protein